MHTETKVTFTPENWNRGVTDYFIKTQWGVEDLKQLMGMVVSVLFIAFILHIFTLSFLCDSPGADFCISEKFLAITDRNQKRHETRTTDERNLESKSPVLHL